MENLVLIYPYIATFVTAIALGYCFWVFHRSLNGHPTLVTRGLIRIENNREKALKLLREDVARIEQSLVVLSDSGVDWYWESVEDDLKRCAESGKKITFVVSKDEFASSQHEAIDRLSLLAGVTVLQVAHRPLVDLRLIDGKHIHIARHGADKDNNKRTCWRSEPNGAPEFVLRWAQNFIQSITADASPYCKAA